MDADSLPSVISDIRKLSLTGREWVRRQADDRLVAALCQTLKLPDCVARVLVARGVGLEDAEAFLNPSLKASLPDPSHLLDMDAAAERIAAAIVGGETIAIFGDYDVDGATSSALLALYFKSLGARPITYIPDRIAEGYGPNTKALLELKQRGASVIITVDCGTLSFEPLEAAYEAGVDVIVVDHHMGEARKPKAFAIVNPNRLDESSPHGALAAVGVCFLLTIAVNRCLRKLGWFATRREPDLKQWLDIVALGTVCDVVPLVGLNRALVAQGLKILAGRGNLGLRTLLDVAQVSEAPGVYACGFVLGPRINAGGRVGKSDLGVRLLTTDDPAEALHLARELDMYNGERKTIEAAVLEEAMRMAEAQDAAQPVLVVAGQGWHPGVIGIVAGRLKERFFKPVAVIALQGGSGKASARSVPGFDFGAAVISARDAGLLPSGGGHAMAAGFSVEEGKLAALAEFFAGRVGQKDSVSKARHLNIDAMVSIGGANAVMIESMEKIGPFGQGNPSIRVVVEGVLNLKPDILKDLHVKMLFTDSLSSARLSGIAFRVMGTPLGEALLATRGRKVDVAGQLRLQEWNGQRTVSMTVDDIALAD